MILKQRKFKPFDKNEYSIRRDEVFKIIFGSNERSEYLKEFLEAILHKKITNIVIRNDVALDKEHADDKLMRLDILAEIDGKEKINVEIQNQNAYNMFIRGERAASKLFYDSLKIGDNYVEAKKVIVIWILGYNEFENGPYHEIGQLKKESDNKVISQNITYHYIQLPRFIEEVREIKTEEEQWLAYLSCQLNKKELEELFKMSRSIEEINKIVDIVLSDDDVWNEIDNRLDAQNLEWLKQKKAYDDGKEEGQKQNKIEIAKKMLKDEVDIESIMKFTELSKEEIESLKS